MKKAMLRMTQKLVDFVRRIIDEEISSMDRYYRQFA